MKASGRYLLDTHILIWLSSEISRISPGILSELRDPENQLYVSSASLWEIAIKQNLGKLDLKLDTAAMIQRMMMMELPVTSKYLRTIQELPLHHRDPFDRMLVAQAQLEDMTLVSADVRLRQYDVRLLMA